MTEPTSPDGPGPGTEGRSQDHTDTGELTLTPLRLVFAGISDVGRVRKNNQDSGYAGPWLLTVCDGVGGAAHGEVASATAISALRRLDVPPEAGDLLSMVSGALHRAQDRISELVDEDSSLSGTSTTATVALFDGHRLAMGHLGDSRAYLWRRGRVRQLTTDHTFVQTLIDDGRITEDEARTHPHKNIIIKVLDGSSDLEPDLFHVDVEAGDRILVCSDGASGVLDDDRLADILSSGTADYAAVELVRASLEAGTTDNVTCVVGDVVPADRSPESAGEPLLVGAAAELPRRSGITGFFRGHRSGDTGEIEPIQADLPDDAPASAVVTDPIDPETARYAPREPRRHAWLSRLMALLVVVGIVWVALAAAWSWSQQQYFVSESEGRVAIYRGINADIPGLQLSEVYEITDVQVSRLSEIDAEQVTEGIESDDLDDARVTVDNYAARQDD